MRWTVALALLPHVAHAAPAPAPASAPAAAAPARAPVAAQRHIDRAVSLFRQNDYRGALIAFREAEPMLAGDPSLAVVRFNIARCHEELGELAAAVNAYEAYLAGDDADERRRERAREAVTRLVPRAWGRITVECPPDATAAIDDGAPRACPFTAERVSPGSHKVRAMRPDGVEVVGNAFVEAGREARIALALPETAPAAVAPVEEPSSALGWVLTVGGGALLVTGGVFHYLAADAREEATSLPAGEERGEAIDEFENRRSVALVSYGAGAVAFGLGLYLLLSDEEEPGPVALTPGGFALRW